MTDTTMLVAGLRIRVTSPLNLEFGNHCVPFLCEPSTVDFSYLIEPAVRTIDGEKIFSADMYAVYDCGDTVCREFPVRGGAFVLEYRKNGADRATLYGDADLLQQYETSLIRDFLALEMAMLQKGIFILHSSLVRINDCALVFSGPSKIGKSTQADHWHECMGADILNGDRTCVRILDDRIEGCGSFFAGTSHIYRADHAPLQAIFVLEQSEDVSINRLPYSTAFSHLYGQILHNPWDAGYTKRLINALTETVTRIPVYSLACRADASAVQPVYDLLFNTRLR